MKIKVRIPRDIESVCCVLASCRTENGRQGRTEKGIRASQGGVFYEDKKKGARSDSNDAGVGHEAIT